ncbi:hypothetical protein [Clostridium thermarum]|uniref:hypothetical protein n=1 Tax=Clostridium thermarum TaxID=1716543 RepID=UPI00111CA73B|nr:hypothetical protein [Clostridium thermarum]
MEEKKIALNSFVATIEIEGTEKIKQELKDIEYSLDRILEKFEKVAAVERQVQVQPREINILLDGTIISTSCTKKEKDRARSQEENIDVTILYPNQE